ncbi:MAG: ferredoxin [Leptospiraceae bacterium]|nr:ferredoxin [Leptospiraceae bacterium]
MSVGQTTTGSFTIAHLRENCIGCGSCALIAPEHWTMSSTDGKATLVMSARKKRFFVKKIDSADYASNLEAARSCPVHIIQMQ